MRILPTIQSPADLKRLPVSELPVLAQEIRQAITDQVMKTGGHLAPNLGVVELTIALHYVFDFAWDRLLFDVGHQCYPHKMLTGRYPLLSKLRTREGMAGFPEIDESPYDLFRVGHAGTAVSCAVGMARGDTLNREGFHPTEKPDGRRVVAVVGDSSIVNGVAMEGLNNAGTLKRQLLVILNDNGMSISKPQGALAEVFDRLRLSQTYTDLKKQAAEVLSHVPGGAVVKTAYHRGSEAAKAMISDASAGGGAGWFEHFGLMTVGPIDGHDFDTLIEFLTEAKHTDRPMVLHVKTIKGKGFAPSENDASRLHSPGPFQYDPDSCRVQIKSEGRSFTTAFADALHELMSKDEKAVACTAAMPDGTGLNKILPAFPDRAWDVGICESHALDMMAGLAKTGFKPFLAVYCTFLQRAFDQAFQEAALQNLPVRLCLDRAGLVGGDGAVHHGFCDVALLRTLPNAVITAAIDEPSLRAALEFMRGYDTGLSAVRYPRDVVSDLLTSRGLACPPYELGKAVNLTPAIEQPAAAVLAFGTLAIDALRAADRINAVPGGPRVAVYDARFAKPVDRALIASLLERRIRIVTIEDHSIVGGFGSAVLEAAQELGVDGSLVTRLGLPDRWVYQDSRSKQLAEVGLDEASLHAAFLKAAGAGGPASTPGPEPKVALRAAAVR